MPLAPLGLPAGKGVPARVELQTRAGPRAGSRPPSCSPRASPSALRRPAGRQERGAAVRALSLADLDWSAFPAELSLLGAFASGAALSAVLLAGAREGLPLLGRPSPLRPLPNAARLQQGPDNTTPDRVLTGTGVYVLQHLLNYFYPGLASVLAQVIRKRIQPGLERLQSATLRDIRVEDLTMGDVPPVVTAIKLYDTPPQQIVVDLETEWDSNALLRLGVSFTEGGSLYAPVEVADIRFQGVIRIVFSPMLLSPPYVGAMTFSAAMAPNIDFRIKVLGGEVSAIPGLRETLQEYATSLLNATFLWPTRILLPFRRAKNPADLLFVLSLDEQAGMRVASYDSLSEPRVRSWGSRGLTRRIQKTYGARVGAPRRTLVARAWDAVSGWRRRRREGDIPGSPQPPVAAEQLPAAPAAPVVAPAVAAAPAATQTSVGVVVASELLLSAAAEQLRSRRAGRAAAGWGGRGPRHGKAHHGAAPKLEMEGGFWRRTWRSIRG